MILMPVCSEHEGDLVIRQTGSCGIYSPQAHTTLRQPAPPVRSSCPPAHYRASYRIILCRVFDGHFWGWESANLLILPFRNDVHKNTHFTFAIFKNDYIDLLKDKDISKLDFFFVIKNQRKVIKLDTNASVSFQQLATKETNQANKN